MKFSIVTPSFNQAPFIERTLRSVLAQSALPAGVQIEHVVRDGGSTDGTVQILRAATGLHWASEPDRGQADAVNRGIRATDGEVIGWLNSDDVYHEGAIARVAAFLREHPEVDVVYGDAEHIDVDDRAFEDYPTEEWDFERLKQTCFICQPALFFRRRVAERMGLLDETLHYCMDYEYWLRLGQAGVRFARLHHKLAGSRLYATNKTLGARVQVHREINDMMKSKFGRVPERWIYNYAHIEVESSCTRASAPARFARRVAWRSLAGAWHWNGRPSAAMCRTTAGWLAQSLRQSIEDLRRPHA
jgi:glycosyltransferase involved in cell wall biosynthesis